ncbi:hypothetical protein LRX75_11115 [Rhizobium sp. DKSPLA3]|uniref:Uncharacterized protein n=1 Tax=Rhizobium quercicola TaxID=2901226 RepID=A0A9X1NRE8_9HYPH|nr:hypothetical protein [Rhizobium quercicola]MCD7109597.1 hypothetical protein [Rhizobium quercicola]
MNAIIIPVHPPKIFWAISFLNSLRLFHHKSETRVVLACSNHLDVGFFARTLESLKLGGLVELINVEHQARFCFGQEEVHKTLENAGPAIINRKKFLALHWASIQRFEYSIVMDCDILCLPTFDLDSFVGKVAAAYDLNVQWGATLVAELDALAYPKINEQSLQLFSDHDQARVRASGWEKIYTWFLDPPCYRLDDLQRFFSYMGEVHSGQKGFYEALGWHAFDNVVFTYFRALYCDTQILSYGTSGIAHLPEWLSVEQLSILSHSTGFSPAWATLVSSLNSPAALQACFPECSILYHCDRMNGLETGGV